jgi:hypothetical protein
LLNFQVAAFAIADVPTTLVLNSPLNLAYYPSDSIAYNDLKKSLYDLVLAAGNACFSAQASYDYYSFLKYQGVYQPKLNEKIAKLQNAEQYLNDAYAKYQQELAKYKSTLVCPTPTVTLDDNVEIRSDYL